MSLIYFAWVDATETTFGSEHHREDEDVFSFQIDHKEGELPTLSVDIPNPRVGLLSPGRKVWAWLSFNDGTSVTPLFFGRLVGLPTNLLGEDLTLQFTARPRDYVSLKQRAAEALKVAPGYDPVFLSETKRDDPDAILEGYSAAWHVDRLASAVTASDFLEGEDGTEVFTESEVPYDSVSMSVEQPPLDAVQIIADVTWSQEFSGYVNLGGRSFMTYSGDGVLQDWPKPLQNLDGGWTVALATCVDVWRVDKAQTITRSYQWQNTERAHRNGDTLSVSTSTSTPDLPNGALSKVITESFQSGFVDPTALDSSGDPAPLIIPETYSAQISSVPKWLIIEAMVLRYDASRQRSEKVHLTITSDVQPVITDDGTTRNVETMTVNGGDVGQPILDVKNWSSVAGQAVELGQIIFPDAATGSTTAQIATTAGTAGTTSPSFSDLAGTTTSDGAAVWTSLGATTTIGSAPDWKASSYTPLGTVILPRRPVSIPYDWLVQQGRLEVPQVGTNVNVGTIVEATGSYQVCTESGTTGVAAPSFSATHGATTTDGTVTWESLGPDLPLGSVYFIATTGGTSGSVLPSFANAEGATTSDGSVVWTSLGTADVPIGGWPGHTGRNAYFPTDRGLQSVEYLLCLGRSKLRQRARAVQLTWEIDFERALSLSCRKNATLQDRRLPGGTATGKVIAYTISADGNTGELKATVTIGCAVGNGGSVSTAAGAVTYAAAGYVATGYQYEAGAVVSGSLSDIGYTPPAAATNSDDIVFPLSRADAVKLEVLHGTLADQETAINAALDAAAGAAQRQSPTEDYLLQFQAQQQNTKSAEQYVRDALKGVPIWLELELANLTGGPFEADYFVETTPLVVPKTIDLAAGSTA